jgi:hypothetical protein
MIKTTLPAKRAIAQIVDEYRRLLDPGQQRPLPLRAFALALSEALKPMQRSVSYQTIKNWGDRRYLPDPYTLLTLSQSARNDWRADFAEDLLAIIHPEAYQPASEIGRRARREHLTQNGNGAHA